MKTLPQLDTSNICPLIDVVHRAMWSPIPQHTRRPQMTEGWKLESWARWSEIETWALTQILNMVSDNLIWLHRRALFLYFHLCRYLMSQCDQVPSTNQHPSSLFFAPSATKLPSLVYNTHTSTWSLHDKDGGRENRGWNLWQRMCASIS